MHLSIPEAACGVVGTGGNGGGGGGGGFQLPDMA